MANRKAVSAVTMLVLVGLLVAGAWIGWRTLSAPLPGDEEPERKAKSRCDGGARDGVIEAADVKVSVYNAGSRSGLADQTLSQLVDRGFARGEAGNAPAELESVLVVRVLSPAKGDPTAQLVARQFGANTAVQTVEDGLGPGVEVIVGDNFRGLVDAPTRIKGERARPGC